MSEAGLSASAGLAPTRTTLDNGVVVLAKRTRRTPAVAINLAMRAGSVCDPVGAPGAMNLLARMVDRGTASRSGDDIAEELDSHGVSVAITASRHLFSLTCTCLAVDFDRILPLVGEMVIAPSIPEDQLAVRKGEIVTAIRQDDDNPAVRAVEGLMAALYGSDHPYGLRSKGTISAVEQTTRRDLPPAARQPLCARCADGRSCGRCGYPSRAHRRRPRVQSLAWSDAATGSTGAAVAIDGTPSIGRSDDEQGASGHRVRLHDDHACRSGLLRVLGDEQRARAVRTGWAPRRQHSRAPRDGLLRFQRSRGLDRRRPPDDSRWRWSLQRGSDHRGDCDELSRLRAEGLTPQELTESRQYLTGAMPRVLETNAGIAGFCRQPSF